MHPTLRPLLLLAALLFPPLSLAAGDADPDGGLGWVAERVRQKQTVQAVWMGGSITQGSGASHPSKAYWWLARQQMTKALSERGARLEARQAAVGGTNSVYGAFRFTPQVLAKGAPDLLVLEFTVNDQNTPRAAEGLEGIVRQARRANPHCAIVLLSTTSKAMLAERAAGREPAALAAHRQVAERYRLPHLDAGPAVAELEAAGTPLATLLPDGVHPGDAVHALYARLLADALVAALDRPLPAAALPLPEPVVSDELAWARLEPLPGAPGWEVGKPGYYTWLGTWTATANDARLTIPVRAGSLGLFYITARDLLVTAPGGFEKRLATTGRADGIPNLWLLPERTGGYRGELTLTAAAGPATAANVRLAGLARILPAEERQ